MGFNNPDKPKVLRTQLSKEIHQQFKELAVKKQIPMANLIEQLIIELLRREKDV